MRSQYYYAHQPVQQDSALPWGIFYFVSLAAYCFCVALALFCLLCGLFYLAELTETYSVLTKTVLKNTLRLTAVLFFVFMLAGDLCWWRCLLSVAANGAYYRLLFKFPWVRLSSPASIMAGFMLVVDSLSWYTYFSESDRHYPQWCVLSFFVACCWFSPILFLVSVSVEGDGIPHTANGKPGLEGKKSALQRARSFFSD